MMRLWLILRAMVNQFLGFAAVGAIGTLVHYLVLILAVNLVSIDPVIGSGVGFVCGAFVNYILNYKYVFCSRKKHSEAFRKFFTIALFGIILNTMIIAMMIEILAIHYLYSQVVATGVVLIWNFIGNRIWTFRSAAV